MKRLFALLLAIVLILSLTACGDEENEKTPSNDDKTPGSIQQQEQNTPDPDEGEDEPDNSGSKEIPDPDTSEQADTSADPLTVEGFLKLYGFTTDDLTPNYFVSFEEIQMVGSKAPGERDSKGIVKINVEKGKTTEDDYNAWFENLYAKMTELSDDGKLYFTAGKAAEAPTLDELQAEAWWTARPGSTCYITVDINGKATRINLDYSYDIEAEQYKLIIMAG